MFSIFLISVKSNDITNIFEKSILVQKIALTSTVWNKEQRFASLITVKSRQLSTVPINFDCSRVWQWTVYSTTVAFGSESVNAYFVRKHWNMTKHFLELKDTSILIFQHVPILKSKKELALNLIEIISSMKRWESKTTPDLENEWLWWNVVRCHS